MSILIFGSKDFARTVRELAEACGHRVAGLIDDFNSGPEILGTLDEVSRSHPPGQHDVAMAIGYSNIPARWSAWERVRAAGYAAPALVHPRAYVADSAKIGAGVMVMAGAIVDVRATVGELTVVWPSACINHDATVGRNCFVSPGAILCGHAALGHNCFVGAGAAIVDRAEVPSGAFIKMLSRFTR